MSDQSQGAFLTSTAKEIERDEFLKNVNIGDTIKHHDNSESIVVKKVYVQQMSNNYKIEIFSERP
ncbi:hypothetical protein J2W17_005958 [Pseudomonas lini]|uniref:hypothetical protein n=1 Tax=Pseudomonas lini TaxID=163011 RepID=UPI002789EEA5|nr:hypothetical protein [Pseudomonas lini]MDQ0126960.1 hypothetical protein [Pseudomonas lini]